jgi:hypothetical protein
MAETIKCPYTQDGASPHNFKHEVQIKDGYTIHYCGKCKNVISIETQSNVIDINRADGFYSSGDI